MHDPRWRQPAWATPAGLALGWAAVIAYGSLLPLRFDLAGHLARHEGLAAAVWAWLSSPTWRGLDSRPSQMGIAAWQSDLALNLVLYVPLGLLLRWALMRRGGPAWRQVAMAVGLVATMTWAIEATQSLMPARVASINDVLANVLPAAAAVLLTPLVRRVFKAVVRWTWSSIRPVAKAGCAAMRRRPVTEAVAVLVGVVALWLARPGGMPSMAGPIRLDVLPFARHFAMPYDVAVWELARSSLLYAALAGAVGLLLGRQRLAATVPVVGGLALAAELFQAGTRTGRLDLAEPLVAATVAAGVVVTLVYAGRSLAPASGGARPSRHPA